MFFARLQQRLDELKEAASRKREEEHEEEAYSPSHPELSGFHQEEAPPLHSFYGSNGYTYPPPPPLHHQFAPHAPSQPKYYNSPTYAPNSPVYTASSPPYVAVSPVYTATSPPYVAVSPPYVASHVANSPTFIPKVKNEMNEWSCDIVRWLAIFNSFFGTVQAGPPPIVNSTLCIDLSMLPLLPCSFINQGIIDAVERLMAAASHELPSSAPINGMSVKFDAEIGFSVNKPVAGLCIPFQVHDNGGGGSGTSVVLRSLPLTKLEKWDFWKSARVYTRQIKACLATTRLRTTDLPTLTRCVFMLDSTPPLTWPLPASVASGADSTKPGLCMHKLVAMSVDATSFSRVLKSFKERIEKQNIGLERVLLDFAVPVAQAAQFTQTQLILHLAGLTVDVLKPFVPLDMEALERWELQQIKLVLDHPSPPPQRRNTNEFKRKRSNKDYDLGSFIPARIKKT